MWIVVCKTHCGLFSAACDGIWDVMSSEEVASYARVRAMVGARSSLLCEVVQLALLCAPESLHVSALPLQGDVSPTTVTLTDVCSSLLDDCLSLNSRDNMTASIVRASSFLLWAWMNNHRAFVL